MFKGGAGKLNRLITLQRLPDPDGPKNDFGELLAIPVNDIVDIKAAYEPAGTRSFPDREKRYSETEARFRIRYRSDIAVARTSARKALPETHRVVYVVDHNTSPAATRLFRITGADVIGQLDEIHIEVSEIR